MWVDSEFGIDGVSRFGLFNASATICTDLGGVGGTKKKILCSEMTKFGEAFGEKSGVVETTTANVFEGSGKRNDDGINCECGG